MLATFNKLFPLWALLITVIAFLFNGIFAQLQSLIVPLLALVMFVMGLTLSSEDFKRVLVMPTPIAIGVILQFLVMPFTAMILAGILQLSTQLTVGMSSLAVAQAVRHPMLSVTWPRVTWRYRSV